jgi:hypothetical protein
VTVDVSALDYVGFTVPAQPAGTQAIGFTITSGTGLYYARLHLDHPERFASPQFDQATASHASWLLAPNPGLAQADAGSVQLQLCADSGCAQMVWHQDVTYQIHQYTVSMATIAVAGYEGAPTTPVAMSITPVDTDHRLQTLAMQNDSGPKWLTTRRGSDDALQVVTDTGSLTQRALSGQVQVSFTGDTSVPAVAVPVAFTIGAGFVTPQAPAHALGRTSAGRQTAGLPIAFNGQQAPAWTATSDMPWLTLVNASGTGAATLRYTVDAATGASSANWTSSVAHVTVHAAGHTDLVVPVTLSRQLPEAYLVHPAVVTAGQDAHVHLFGRGFTQLPANAGISVGGATVTGIQVVSDHEAWIDIAAIAGGRHVVSLANTSAVSVARGLVSAVDPEAAPAAAFVASAGVKGPMILDEGRSAVYATNYSTQQVQRFMRDAQGRWLISSLPVAQPNALGLSPDGRTLLVTSGWSTVVTIDPDAFVATGSYVNERSTVAPPYMASVRIAFSNDGYAWFSGGSGSGGPQGFSLTHRAFDAPFGFGGMLYQPVPFAPPDGSRLYFTQWGISPSQPTSVYGVGLPSDGYTPLPAQSTSIEVPSFDQAGTLLAGAQLGLFDDRGNNMGSLGGSNWILPTLSPDGRRAYQVPYAGLNCGGSLNVTDTSGAAVNGPPLAPFAQLPYAQAADSCDFDSSWSSTLVVDTHGRTVYWLGDQGLAVIPVPAQLRPAAASARSRATVSSSRSSARAGH